jgi:hypothetical protein
LDAVSLVHKKAARAHLINGHELVRRLGMQEPVSYGFMLGDIPRPRSSLHRSLLIHRPYRASRQAVDPPILPSEIVEPLPFIMPARVDR